MATTPLSADQTVVGKLDPASQAAGTVNTGWVDMAAFRRVQFLLGVGAMTAGSTVDAAVRQATSSAGAGAKSLAASKAIAQLTQAAANGNSVCALNVRGSDLDTNNAYRFVSLQVTVGTAASVLGVVALGDPESTPPSSTNGSITAQVV